MLAALLLLAAVPSTTAWADVAPGPWPRPRPLPPGPPGPPRPQPQPRHDAEVAQLARDYLDGLFRARPHLATFMGEHRHDGELPDYAPAAIARRREELRALGDRARKLEPRAAAMPLDAQVDLAIVSGALRLEQLYLDEIRDFAWDPRLIDTLPWYDPREILASRLSDIIHGDFAPAADRRKSVVAQLAAVPRFLDGKRRAMDKVSKAHLEQAIKAGRGTLDFFRGELAEYTRGDAEADKARLAALGSLEEYQRFLEKELPARATRDWRLGTEPYRRKFALALDTTRSPDEALARAERAFAAARAELGEVAIALHRKLWPADKSIAAGAKLDAKAMARVIVRVKDEIAKDHPAPADLVAAHGRRLDRLRQFVAANNLVALPGTETLAVEPMPAYKRGAVAAEYLAPGMLDTRATWRATYYVDPIDPTWSLDRVESYLRANNDYAVELTAAHEAYPGHHTQTWYARRELSPLRATLWNGPMVEGWAVYGEDLLTRLGYGGERADRYRFTALKGLMIVAANLILDVKLQTGRMSDEEAVRFMVDDCFQERAQAEKKLVRARLDSTQLAQYFLGFDEIRELEAEHRKLVGRGFSQRAFDEALLGHGSIAVGHLRRYLMSGR